MYDIISSLQDALMGTPGIDGRLWVSYGTVELDQDVEDGRSVEFDEEVGPLVSVRLHPRNDTIVCRVGMAISGALEGAYAPFVGGDEVLVVVPEGELYSPPVIIARLANKLDAFPTKVAGQETDKNNIAFVRTRSPIIAEGGSSIMIRGAMSGAFIGIDETGNITVRDGAKAALQFGSSGMAVQGPEGDGQIVLNHEKQFVSLWWDNSMVQVEKDSATVLSGGNVLLAGAGNMANVHAIGLEQVVNLLVAYLGLLSSAVSSLPSPITSPALAAIINPVVGGLPLINGALALAGTGTAPGYNLFMPAMAAGAKVLPTSINPAPGLACPGVLLG